jgi:glutamate 5-kinase
MILDILKLKSNLSNKQWDISIKALKKMEIIKIINENDLLMVELKSIL